MPRHLTLAALAALAAASVAAPGADAKQIYFAGKGPTHLPQEGPIPPKVTGRPAPGVGVALRLGCLYGEVGHETTYQLDALGLGSPTFRIDGGDYYEPSSGNTLFAASGVTLDEATGVLSGTPKSPAAGVITYDAFSDDGEDYARSTICYQFTQSPDTPDTGLIFPRILPPDGDSPTTVQTNQYLELNFSQVYGFYGVVTYAIDPKPPKGLTFTNGVLSGQLADPQVYKFSVKVVDSRGEDNQMDWSVNVTNPLPLQPRAADESCVTGTVGDVVDRETFTVDVPDDQYTDVRYTLTDSPPGLTIGGLSGRLTGTLQPFLDGTEYKEWTRPIGIDVFIGTERNSTVYSMSLCADIKMRTEADKPSADNRYTVKKATVSPGQGGSYVTGQQIKVPVPTSDGFQGYVSYSVLPYPPPGLNLWPDGHMSGSVAYPLTYSYEVIASDGQVTAVSSRATITVTDKPDATVSYDGGYVLADQEDAVYDFNPFTVADMPSNARWSVLGDLPPSPNKVAVLAQTGDLAVDAGFVVRGSPQDDPKRHCACDGGKTVNYYPTVRVSWTEQDGSYRRVDTTVRIALVVVDFKPTQP